MENLPISQAKLETFECQRCNACCKQPGFVYLDENDTLRASSYLNLHSYDFTDKYCDLEDRRHLVLKKNPDESCVFLSEKGCQIHEAKPEQCRSFPFKWRTPASWDYCEGLRKLSDPNSA